MIMKYKDFKVMSQSEMKKVMGGNATISCYLKGAASCTSPTGVPYGGNTPCEGTYEHCESTGDAACATDACCISWTCDSSSGS